MNQALRNLKGRPYKGDIFLCGPCNVVGPTNRKQLLKYAFAGSGAEME